MIRNIQKKDPKTVYYLLTFTIDFAISFIFVSYSLFLLSKGLDLLQISLVNMFFMLGTFLFEVPTGAFADRYGRKKSVVLGMFLFFVSFIVYFLSESFWFFVAAELIGAVAATFISGAMEAWAVDSIDNNQLNHEATGRADLVLSQASIYSRSATLIGGLIGAYIGQVSLSMPFLFAAIFSLVAFFIARFFITEKAPTHAIKKQKGFLNQINKIALESINYGLHHPTIFYLLIASFILAIACMPLNMFWSPKLDDLSGGKIWLLGWVWVLYALSMLLGSLIFHRLIKKNTNPHIIFYLNATFLSIPIFMAGFSQAFNIVLLGMLAHEIGRGMQRPLQSVYLNRYIQSEKRATVLSFDSMVSKLGGVVGLVGLGFVAKTYSISISWIISAIVMLALFFVYSRMLKAKQK